MTVERRALAALDIGTNSIHLVVARPTADDRFETLTREKEVVRLGHGGGDMKRIAPAAIERGVGCLRRMRGIADSYGAVVRAVATSAVREAENAAEFLVRARDEAGVEIEVISGLEEARLIHLGVLQAAPVYEKRSLIIDIGGGSTEVLIGERDDMLAARSLKIGAVRLSDRFFPHGRVTKKTARACRDHVRDLLSHVHRDVLRHGFDVAVASSGTAETVARMAHAATGADPLRTYNCYEFSAAELSAVHAELVRHTKAVDRAKVRGLEQGRADIIVAGTTILDAAAAMFGVAAFLFSDGALREGVLLDTISRLDSVPVAGRAGSASPVPPLHHLRDVSRRSIRQLADRCDDDPAHSAHVARLAGELFDGLAPLHGLGGPAREYLEAAALLANVGLVVAHSKHHLHTYYVIRNSELAGLTDAEIEVIAQIARYHRKSEPKATHPQFAALSAADQQLVRVLAGILRVAIGLDRTHQARVRSVRCDIDGPAVRVSIVSDLDVELEAYAANERRHLLEAVLGRPIELRVEAATAPAMAPVG